MMCQQANHQWLGRFSVALMKLRQGTSLPSAVSRAVVAHEYLHDMVPEEAAALEARVLATGFGDRKSRPTAPRAFGR